jgi:hypothetical protein
LASQCTVGARWRMHPLPSPPSLARCIYCDDARKSCCRGTNKFFFDRFFMLSAWQDSIHLTLVYFATRANPRMEREQQSSLSPACIFAWLETRGERRSAAAINLFRSGCLSVSLSLGRAEAASACCAFNQNKTHTSPPYFCSRPTMSSEREKNCPNAHITPRHVVSLL